MSPEISQKPGSMNEKFSRTLPGGSCTAGAVSGLLLFLLCALFFNYMYGQQSCGLNLPVALNWRGWTGNSADTTTTLGHIVFGVTSSVNTLGARKAYIESWWRPNITRGYVFMDSIPADESLLCPLTCPPLRTNEDITRWEVYPKISSPVQIRMAQSILEVFKQGDKDVRWFVMADDDTVLFVDNLVQVLSGYDHTKYFYMGGTSESISSNNDISFDMGYGGASLILSYPLAAAMALKFEGCIKRYPDTWVYDLLTYICVSELGVVVTHHKGLHQIDLHDSLAGFLSSHPQTPLLSLHHLDAVDPIFPAMDRHDSIRRLMKPGAIDQSRLLQQSVCFTREWNWSVSISWGYSAHIYENVLPRYLLQRPIETFKPWIADAKPPKYMFNTRPVSSDPCEAPHWFFLESIYGHYEDHLVTTYSRAWNRELAPCLISGNHTADHVDKIRVFSPAKLHLEAGRVDCCEVISTEKNNTTLTVRIRPCMDAEEII